MMRWLINIALLLIFWFFHLTGLAQVHLTARLDTNLILIGQQTGLTLELSAPDKPEVEWPVFQDTITGHIEVVGTPEERVIKGNKREAWVALSRWMVTSFDSGYFAIPPMTVRYRIKGDTSWKTISSEPLLLGVSTVPVDLQAGFKDIKGPYEAPFTLMEILPWILIFLGVALVTSGVLYYLKRRKENKPVFRAPPPPPPPPHKAAIEALESLRYKKLWQQGKIKEYHTELTDILRRYVSQQFGFHALEATTGEIMEFMQTTAINETALAKLQQTLKLADMVKFAKYKPQPLEHDNSLNLAIDFVKESYATVMSQMAANENSPQALADVDEKKPEEKLLKEERHVS
ncbi:MAG: hypothetical protein Kow00127_22780 [Bacteroidales bacterium]